MTSQIADDVQIDHPSTAAVGGHPILGITGWLGGELTFRERIGVVPLAER